MCIQNVNFNVPFLRWFRYVYLKVDKSIFLTTLTFVILGHSIYAQESKRLDSLLKVYNNLDDGIPKIKTLESLFYETIYNDPKEGEKYSRLSITLSKQLDNVEGLGVAMYHLGVSKQLQTQLDSALYYHKETAAYFKKNKDMPHYASTISALSDIERRRGNYDLAIEYTKEANTILKSVNDQLRYGIGVGDLGSIYDDLGNKKLAIEKTIEALKILDTVKQEPWRKADLMRQIGRIELDRQNYESSLNYLNQALKVYEDTNDNIWTAYTLTDIGNNYLDSKKYDDAIQTYGKVMELAEKYNLSDTKANVIGNLGVIYYEKGLISQSREKLNEALQYNTSINELYNILSNLLAMTRLEIKANNLKIAEGYADKGIKKADSINKLDKKRDFHFFRSKIYESQGLFKKALAEFNTYNELNDSLNLVNNAKQIDALRIGYETEQKEKELIIKKNKIDLLEERKQKAENEKLFLLITLIGAIAFAIAVVYGLRQKIKRNKTEREKLDNDLAYKEKELTTHALHLAHKNEVLLELKSQIKELKNSSNSPRNYQKVINTINLDINNDNTWEQFRNYFEDVHKDFNSKVMRNYPEVSNNDLRLMSLLKMNLSSKEIANILNISVEGVKKARYRLRKKLNLNTEESLQELVIEL